MPLFANIAQLNPNYWLEKLAKPHELYLSAAQICQHNAQMLANEPSLLDLNQVPNALSKSSVLVKINQSSQRSQNTLYTENGEALDENTWHALSDNCALDHLAQNITPRYGLIVTRANIRRFPSNQPVYTGKEEHDIDRFQESALFPGDAVILLHPSRDQLWWYIGSQHYYGWVAKEAIAIGSRKQILDYIQRTPTRIITGSVVHTVYTPQLPEISCLPLDMGVRIPLYTDWPLDKPVNGQRAAASWVLQLPLHHTDGSLRFTPALLPYSADSCDDYLPLTPENIIRQAFKFLGERYGWGHRFHARDCSGLVCEIYRSMGILLPRNSGDQAKNTVLDTVNLPQPHNHSERLTALQQLEIGDLVYIPGHVMLVIGHDQNLTWVIHDTAQSGYLNTEGNFIQIPVNGVVVTPLEYLYLDKNTSYIEKIISIKRLNKYIANNSQ